MGIIQNGVRQTGSDEPWLLDGLGTTAGDVDDEVGWRAQGRTCARVWAEAETKPGPETGAETETAERKRKRKH